MQIKDKARTDNKGYRILASLNEDQNNNVLFGNEGRSCESLWNSMLLKLVDTQ